MRLLEDMTINNNQPIGQTAGPVADYRYSLLRALEEAVRETPGDALLLSGGIDSSLLAALSREFGREMPAITVALDGYESHEKPNAHAGCKICKLNLQYPQGCGSDMSYAREVAQHLNMVPDWYPLVINREQAFATLKELVAHKKSYSMELLNDVAIYSGLKYARDMGYRTVWTGDDADTLFAGYGFFYDEEKWQEYKISRFPHIQPPASELSDILNTTVRYPYLHASVMEVANSLRLSDNVEWRSDSQAGNFYYQYSHTRKKKQWGKLPLRTLAKAYLPASVAQRQKTHIEFGAATCRLEWVLAQSLTKEGRALTNATLTLDGTMRRCFANAAHRALYLMYVDQGIEAPSPLKGESQCKWCGAGGVVGEVNGYCKICGAFPALTRPTKKCP